MNDSNDFDVSEFMEEGDFDGRGKTFDDACEAAWEKAKVHHPSGTWFKVKHQWVEMVNPISEHKVVIGPGG